MNETISVNIDIPEGWRFYTADWSIPTTCHVLLIRDENGCKWWHGLDEEQQDKTDLYVSGCGNDLSEAVTDACNVVLL